MFSRTRFPALLALSLLCACAGSSGKDRSTRAEERTLEAEGIVREAEQALDREDPDEAEDLLEEASEVLSDPVVVAYPEHHEVKESLQRAKDRVSEVRAEMEKKRFEARVAEQSEKVKKARDKMTEAANEILSPVGPVEKDHFERADATKAELIEVLDDGHELEAKHEGYKALATETRDTAKQLFEEVQKAAVVIGFNHGVVASLERGQELSKEAKRERDNARKEELYREASGLFRSCGEEAKRRMDSAPELKKVKFEVNRRKLRPQKIAQTCAREAKTADRRVKQLVKKREAEERRRQRKAKQRAKKKRK